MIWIPVGMFAWGVASNMWLICLSDEKRKKARVQSIPRRSDSAVSLFVGAFCIYAILNG